MSRSVTSFNNIVQYVLDTRNEEEQRHRRIAWLVMVGEMPWEMQSNENDSGMREFLDKHMEQIMCELNDDQS